jgi:hypothetical protein
MGNTLEKNNVWRTMHEIRVLKREKKDMLSYPYRPIYTMDRGAYKPWAIQYL